MFTLPASREYLGGTRPRARLPDGWEWLYSPPAVGVLVWHETEGTSARRLGIVYTPRPPREYWCGTRPRARVWGKRHPRPCDAVHGCTPGNYSAKLLPRWVGGVISGARSAEITPAKSSLGCYNSSQEMWKRPAGKILGRFARGVISTSGNNYILYIMPAPPRRWKLLRAMCEPPPRLVWRPC